MSDVIIRPIDIERDADKLAIMWNESDLQWPGSWTHGVPITADRVREWEEEDRMLVVYVAEVDGEIAGYCSFMNDAHGLKNEGYLALLNVHPKYQKRSIGRRLIQATIERSVQEGWQRQTLGTWSANFKAVPTYKKTGHFWAPDSSVWMQNYIPGALQMPLAKPFFERHDWYRCYVRELSQGEDDQRWEGLKVFTQHWEADGEVLTIWIDREARAPVAVETDAVLVAAIAEELEPLAGRETTLRWRIANKGAEPLRVYLHAMGDQGLSIDHRATWLVPAGETVEHSARVKVADDASPRKDDGTAPAVRSLLAVNDCEVELFSGLRARKPVSLDTSPAAITLLPGLPGEIKLQLHSELDTPLTATLWLTPGHGMGLDRRRAEIELPAKGHLSLPVQVTLEDEGIATLAVRVEFPPESGLKAVAESLTLYGLRPGGLLAGRQGESVRVETDELRMTISAKGGNLKVEDRRTDLVLASLLPRIGPPYYPSEFEDKGFTLELREASGAVAVHMAAEAQHYPGLYLHQVITLTAAGVATLRCTLENRGSVAYCKRLCLTRRGMDLERTWLTLPLVQGIVRAPWLDLTLSSEDVPREPSAYAQPWLVWECEGAAAGLSWVNALAKLNVDWGIRLDFGELSVEPGQSSAPICLTFYAGRGDWRAAATVLQRATSNARVEPPALQTRPVAWARLEPAVMATVADHAVGRLRVDSVIQRTDDGQVALATDGGLQATPERVAVAGLNRQHPTEQDIAFDLPSGKLGVYEGQTHLTLPICDRVQPFHILRLGTGQTVSIGQEEQSGHPVWTLDNGAGRIIVAPDYCGSVVAWLRGGENVLYSTFPEPQGFSWEYPWFGGIQPLLYPVGSECSEGYLHREHLEAEAVDAPDAQGLPWQGVRLSTRPAKKELADLRVELDYLTLGGANLIKFVYRVRNLRATAQAVHVGSRIAARLGAAPTDLAVYSEHIARQPTNWSAWLGAKTWGALSNPHSGATLLLVSPQTDVLLPDTGQHGRVLGTSVDARLAGDETRQYVAYIVLAESYAAALRYLALCDYTG